MYQCPLTKVFLLFFESLESNGLPPLWEKLSRKSPKFIPSRDSFGFSEDLEPPTKKIPWYTKPIKDVPGKGAEKPSEKSSRKDPENDSKKPLATKGEKPQKKSDKADTKDLDINRNNSNNE